MSKPEIFSYYRALTEAIKVTGSQSAAKQLLAAILGREPIFISHLSKKEAKLFQSWLSRIETGEPLQYVTGKAYFRNTNLKVGPGVFIPRPETELLVQWALDFLPEKAIVLECGTGSGAIAKSLAQEGKNLDIYALEVDPTAYEYATENLYGTGVNLRLGAFQRALDFWPKLAKNVDLVISNPPYIPLERFEEVAENVRKYEPHLALFSGVDGLAAIRDLVALAGFCLRPGGYLAFEHAELQKNSIIEFLLKQQEYVQIRNHLDLAQRPRFTTAQKIAI